MRANSSAWHNMKGGAWLIGGVGKRGGAFTVGIPLVMLKLAPIRSRRVDHLLFRRSAIRSTTSSYALMPLDFDSFGQSHACRFSALNIGGGMLSPLVQHLVQRQHPRRVVSATSSAC